MIDRVLLLNLALFSCGVLLGALGLLTLRNKLGWARMCALMAVWAIAADNKGRALKAIATLTPPHYTDWCDLPHGWSYVPLAVQAIVALGLLLICLLDRRKP